MHGNEKEKFRTVLTSGECHGVEEMHRFHACVRYLYHSPIQRHRERSISFLIKDPKQINKNFTFVKFQDEKDVLYIAYSL